MLKEEKTNRYVLGVNTPIVYFDLGNSGFKMDWATKVMVEENKDELLVLIKHETTSNDLENIEIGQSIDMVFEYLSKSLDDSSVFSTKKGYKNMHLISKYHTDIHYDTDMIKIFSSKRDSNNIDRIIRRDEQEQLRNTTYKLKPNSVTYNVNCDLKDLKLDVEKFTDEITKIAKRQVKLR